MTYNNYITPYDIVYRFTLRYHFYWPSTPTVTVIGGEGTFGGLLFSFTVGDDIIDLSLNLYIKDQKAILAAANEAIQKWDEILRGICDEEEGD